MTVRPKIIDQGLSYGSVLLVPSYSKISSRYSNELDTSTTIARGLPKINLPIMAANMHTVTEADMAIEMALHGAVGVIHRLNSPEEQAEQIRRVKEFIRIIEEDPPVLSERTPITLARAEAEKHKRGYVLIHPGTKPTPHLIGIATTRDFNAAESSDQLLRHIMTTEVITAPFGTTLDQAAAIMRKNRIEKLPVVDPKGTLRGVFTLKDFDIIQQYPHAAVDSYGRLMVGAGIGVHEIDIERMHRIQEAGGDFEVVDIAHGHSEYVKKTLSRYKKQEKIKLPVIAGNIATKRGAEELYEWGADAIKVGIGPGFVCDTRNVAGTGIPQITAVLNASEAMATKQKPIPVIADGGIREPGDIPKAIAAGADAVMIGSLFAGTDKSPGQVVFDGGKAQKVVSGMASDEALKRRKQIGESTTNARQYAPEGRTKLVPYRGSTEKILLELVGGLKSGMSYAGTPSIELMKKTAQLQQVNAYGLEEQRRELR